MLTINYCSKCFFKLCSYGYLARKLYCEIAEKYIIYDETPEVSTSVHSRQRGISETLDFLESKGLVVTTENGFDSVLAKPVGIECYDDDECVSCHICFERHIHEKID